MRIVVIGAGSIGLRHIRNLITLGHEVMNVETDLVARARAQAHGAAYWDDQPMPDAEVIATPANHRPLCPLPALIEKPLSISSESWETNTKGYYSPDHILQLGYNLRFDAGLRRFRHSLPDNIASARIWFSQRLTEWRAGDYRTSVSAQKKLGGGVIREASHELDLVRWLFGTWSWLYADVRHTSDLETDVEDHVAAVIGLCDGFTVSLELGMVQSGYRRGVEVVTRDGKTFGWRPQWNNEEELNAMYLEEMRAFLRSVETGQLDPNAATLEDGIEALRLVEAMEESSKTRTVIYNPRGSETEGELMGRGLWRAA